MSKEELAKEAKKLKKKDDKKKLLAEFENLK